MPNSIAYTQNYTSVIDEVYQRASVSSCLNSGRRMVRAGRNAKEILIPKIFVTVHTARLTDGDSMMCR